MTALTCTGAPLAPAARGRLLATSILFSPTTPHAAPTRRRSPGSNVHIPVGGVEHTAAIDRPQKPSSGGSCGANPRPRHPGAAPSGRFRP